MPPAPDRRPCRCRSLFRGRPLACIPAPASLLLPTEGGYCRSCSPDAGRGHTDLADVPSRRLSVASVATPVGRPHELSVALVPVNVFLSYRAVTREHPENRVDDLGMLRH